MVSVSSFEVISDYSRLDVDNLIVSIDVSFGNSIRRMLLSHITELA